MDKLKVPSRIGQCRIIHCGTYINKIQYLTFGTVLEVIKYRLCVCESQSFVSDFLRPHGLYSPWNSPGQNARVDSLSLLQGIFPTQGSNPGLPHCRRILHQLSQKGSPRTDYLYPKQCFSHTPDQQQFNKHVLSRAWGWSGDRRILLWKNVWSSYSQPLFEHLLKEEKLP